MDSRFIDGFAGSLDIDRRRDCPAKGHPHENGSHTGERRRAQAQGAALLLCGDRRLSLTRLQINRSRTPDGSAGKVGENSMSNAYIIEIGSHTAGIVAKDQRIYRFFSSDLIFDSLEGREFHSARDAERAARALALERRHLVSGQFFAVS
jgi:hypothetical protein